MPEAGSVLWLSPLSLDLGQVGLDEAHLILQQGSPLDVEDCSEELLPQ